MSAGRNSIFLSILLAGGLASAVAAAPSKPDDLGHFVPGDAWLYVRHINTPSRDFLDAHWDRVFNALASSGISREWKRALAGGLTGDERAQFDATWSLVTERFGAVHWRDLVAEEVVFAERLGGLIPDVIFLCRPAAATRDANVKGLSEIFRTATTLNQDGDICFREYEDSGVQVWALEITKAPVGFYLIHKDDVVGAVLGKAGCDDVVSLLAGRRDKPAMVTTPRYRAALANVPTPEFDVGFLDFERLFRVLPRYPAMMLGQHEGDLVRKKAPGLLVAQRLFATVVSRLDFLDYVVFSGTMDGRQELNYTFTRIKPENADKPLCCMATQRRQLHDFHRFLPKETLSYTVSSFIDLKILYDTILDVIRTELPNGPAYCQEWADLQRQWGFDVHEDLLSWYSGELIDVTLPAAIPNAYGSGDGVVLLRVSDPAKASVKVNAAIDKLKAFLAGEGHELIDMPARTLPVEGFRNLNHFLLAPMMIQPCVGVWEDWLVIATSEAAILKVMRTAAGQHPSIRDNQRFVREGLRAEGPVYAASFTDLSQINEQLTAMFIGMGFAGEMIPSEPGTRPLKAMINSLGRLGPVVAEIDFYSSTGSITTFDGHGWRTTTKVTYKPDRKPAEAGSR